MVPPFLLIYNMNRKNVFYFIAILTMIMLSISNISCSSDDNDKNNPTVIPSGTYVEENGDPSELFTMVVNGYNIKVTITQNGEVWQTFEGTYKINGNTINIVTSSGTESGYFYMSDNRVTIGEITYIKQY
jgi:hypothetical protein